MNPGRAAVGYRESRPGQATLVAREDVHDELHAILASAPGSTLYGHASRSVGRSEMQGRGPVYAMALPSGRRVVVRHNRHGGLLASLTGDLFLPPGNAPRELRTSLSLAEAHVDTVAVLAYAVYPAGPFCRSDVVSAHVSPARDLAEVMMRGSQAERAAAWTATVDLLSLMRTAGAFHPDLNLKNVLIAEEAGAVRAVVLDVDRIRFLDAHNDWKVDRNWLRLARSARKWVSLFGAQITDAELSDVSLRVGRMEG